MVTIGQVPQKISNTSRHDVFLLEKIYLKGYFHPQKQKNGRSLRFGRLRTAGSCCFAQWFISELLQKSIRFGHCAHVVIAEYDAVACVFLRFLKLFSSLAHQILAQHGMQMHANAHCNQCFIYRDIDEINKVTLMMEEECDIDTAAEMLKAEDGEDLKLVVYDEHKKGFYIRQRHFDLNDIRLLAECVAAVFLFERCIKDVSWMLGRCMEVAWKMYQSSFIMLFKGFSRSKSRCTSLPYRLTYFRVMSRVEWPNIACNCSIPPPARI